ncbi:MAG: minor capsid protein [Lachnospiraceae bacterium]|nr:minor capsid protein [Clostridia bacterium]MBR0085653.1 minor capsid protein [Lachnospiraceae bacterium]
MNNRYWYEREALHYKQNLVKLGTYDRRIERLYMRAYAAVEKEIDAFWQKYARDNHLTYADAQKQIDSFDVEAFRSRAKELVKNRDFSPQANRELKLYNATMRLNRLELLKANIGLDLVRDFSEMEDEFKECLNEEAKAEYKRQSGILDDYTQDVPSKVIDSIVGSSFHNATFSDRIWAHQDELRYRLESILVNGLVQGRNPRDFIPQMRKEFGTSRYNAERLLRTEFARVQTDTQMHMFEENGYTEYIFIANGTACRQCSDLNGQHFRVSEQEIGENAPPVHPNCMCSTAAYAATKTLGVGGAHNVNTTHEYLGTIDYNKASEALDYYGNLIRKQPVENAIVIDEEGRVIRFVGERDTVDISDVNLEGAYITHNHILENGDVAFGEDDFLFIREHQNIKELRAVSKNYNYKLQVVADISELTYTDVQKWALEFVLQGYEMQHAGCLGLAKRGYIKYERKEIDR